MSFSQIAQLLVLGMAPLGAGSYALCRAKARPERFGGAKFHSPSWYYGWYGFLWAFLPPLLLAVASWVMRLAGLRPAPDWVLMALAMGLGLAGLMYALRSVNPELRARNSVEGVIHWTLRLSSVLSILITVGIVSSVLFEALQFFSQVSLWEFLTGTAWSPGTAFLGAAGRETEGVAKPLFGSVPLFAGTFLITAISLLVAVPIGLFAAIFLSEYASLPMRRIFKPALEILAGIPSVVYGFFAAITVSPWVVNTAQALGVRADYTNALSPGLVMGVMIIPFVSSLSDDVLNAVPMSMREGSYALGATTSETIRRVLLPAALPGIVAAVLLAFSRAVGETMIVVMAAGLRPNLTWNPLEGVTTVTVRIVDALVGDQAFDSLETLSAFGLGLVLLVFTLILNVISAYIIRRFRQKYE
ncbi:MAG: phosphate ABC transporter permease subunit PstC [Desulfocurvibacter africanus]